MHPDYSHALEKRKDWLHYANKTNNFPSNVYDGLDLYQYILLNADTYVMNRKFCELVDLARKTVPDDLVFETSWVPTKCGWLYITTPFSIPDLEIPDAMDTRLKKLLGHPTHGLMKISAIGWYCVNQKGVDNYNKLVAESREDPEDFHNRLRYIQPGAVQFCCFHDLSDLGPSAGFSMWSYFVLNPGDRLDNRIAQFERESPKAVDSGSYAEGQSYVLHEVRWIYTALHLMSQKLTTTVQRTATRGTRRRFERDKTPINPEYRIITLRRMEEDREKVPEDRLTIDWQWSWICHGHWRNQWYPVEQEHKRIWIEEYIKGDLEKPLKPSKVLYRVAK